MVQGDVSVSLSDLEPIFGKPGSSEEAAAWHTILWTHGCMLAIDQVYPRESQAKREEFFCTWIKPGGSGEEWTVPNPD